MRLFWGWGGILIPKFFLYVFFVFKSLRKGGNAKKKEKKKRKAD